jgi:tripartite-type tricarboxylate transporter receptor subunit TctC
MTEESTMTEQSRVAAAPGIRSHPFVHALAWLCLSCAAGLAQAQGYPNRPIKLIIPYAAGNTGDISFRTIAPALETRLGQRFILENKPGAGGNIGAAEVARAAPDGYTLLLGATNNFVVNQYVYKSISFDPLTSFVPITMVSDAPSIVVVHPGVPANSLRELQQYAKSNPGKLNYSSPNSGTPPHLAGELFAKLADVNITHIPYKGSPAAVVALLSNDVQMYFSVLSAVEGNLKAGKMKALAVASTRRLAAMPALPTSAEAGFPELLTGTWWGLVAPKGIDAKIVERLAADVRAVLADPAMAGRFAELGMIPGGQSPAEFNAQIQSEAAKWKKVIETIGLRAE